MTFFLYVLCEAFIGAFCWWTSFVCFKMWYSLRKRKDTSFARSYIDRHFRLGVYWAFGGAARITWAATVGWNAGSPWPYIWLGLWCVLSVENGYKIDADYRLSKWQHWRDTLNTENRMTKHSRQILLVLMSVAFAGSLIFYHQQN